jgi:hypothetical protein
MVASADFSFFQGYMTDEYRFDLTSTFYCSTCKSLREDKTTVTALTSHPHPSQLFDLSSQQERECPICRNNIAPENLRAIRPAVGIESLRACAKEVSQAILSGRVGIVEASRELACLGHTPDVMNEEIHNVFVGACSESDHLPIGAVRDLWNPQVLEEKDREIADIEARWKDRILAACKSILEEQR